MNKNLLGMLRQPADDASGAGVAEQLRDSLQANPIPLATTGQALGLESAHDSGTLQRVETALTRVQGSVESILGPTIDPSVDSEVRTLALESATLGVLFAAKPSDFIDHNPVLPAPGVKPGKAGLRLVPYYNPAEMARPSLEAFDETSTQRAAPFTAVYNVRVASNQDGVDGLFFPSELGDPSSSILSRSITVPVIQNDLVRSADGTLAPFNYQNLMRAHRNHTILQDTSTRVYPIVRPSTVNKLVATALVPHKEIKIDGVESLTAPLMFGERYDLLGISQPDNMIARGLNDTTDVLHPAMSLDAVYVGLPANAGVIRFATRDLMSAGMTESVSGRDRGLVLNFNNSHLTVSKHTLKQDGTNLTTFGGLTLADGWVIRLAVNVTGNVNLATGDTEFYMNAVRLSSVTNPAGELVAPQAAEYLAVDTAVEDMVAVGYDVYARRSNLNRRQLGMILEQITFTQVFPVPYGSPISVIRPTDEQAHPMLNVDSLIYATKLMSVHNAVTRLLETRDRLRQHMKNPKDGNHFDEIMGIGSIAVRPTFIELDMDMLTAVDSLTSTDRRSDIAAAFENYIRNVGYQLYIASEISTAAEYYLGSSAKPVLKVATSPLIAQYLNNLTNTTYEDVIFEVRVAADITWRMNDMIAITLHYDSKNENDFNPCQFGFRAIYPEVIAARNPTFRNGAQSSVMTVTPHFDHYVIMHVLGMINVKNLGKVIGKLGINVNVTPGLPQDIIIGDLSPLP